MMYIRNNPSFPCHLTAHNFFQCIGHRGWCHLRNAPPGSHVTLCTPQSRQHLDRATELLSAKSSLLAEVTRLCGRHDSLLRCMMGQFPASVRRKRKEDTDGISVDMAVTVTRT
ncbi:hypothetical protein BaRGS_00031092 [Batillaria attramentaria]|uniref:Uncharacterized protein n=1 Tax=Batillaria attramentaria TaxID=370345 RepID=A0ABD0JS95_9CAEN